MTNLRNRIIERKDIRVGDLAPAPWNPKTHPEIQRERMSAVLDEFGVADSLKAFYADDGKLTLFDGHLRQSLDDDQVWPVDILDLSEGEARRLVLYYDPMAALAERHEERWQDIAQSFEERNEALAGWLDEMGKDKGEPEVKDVEVQVDKAEELQEKWGVAEGDIWQVGPHYVICGDCREPETWRRLLVKSGHEKVSGVFTSPPYAEQRKAQYGGTPVDEYVEWWEAVQENVKGNLADDGSFFVNIKPHCEKGERVLYVFDLVLAMRRRWGWRFVDELCWKHQGIMGRWSNRLKNQFEPVYHFSVGDISIAHRNVVQPFQSDASALTVSNGIDNRPANTGSPFKRGSKRSAEFDGALPGNVVQVPIGDAGGHAAAFPVALPDFFIRAYSDPGDVWLDPFLGSGTTIVAAHQADGGQRVGLGIEQLPKYVSVCLERFAGLGLEPRLVTQSR